MFAAGESHSEEEGEERGKEREDSDADVSGGGGGGSGSTRQQPTVTDRLDGGTSGALSLSLNDNRDLAILEDFRVGSFDWLTDHFRDNIITMDTHPPQLSSPPS